MNEEKPKPVFYEVCISAPNLSLRFKATNDRIQRVLELVLKEAKECEEEYQATLKEKEPCSVEDLLMLRGILEN